MPRVPEAGNECTAAKTGLKGLRDCRNLELVIRLIGELVPPCRLRHGAVKVRRELRADLILQSSDGVGFCIRLDMLLDWQGSLLVDVYALSSKGVDLVLKVDTCGSP